MQVARHIWAQEVAQSVIAVFNGWEALQTVLVDMAAAELDRSSTGTSPRASASAARLAILGKFLANLDLRVVVHQYAASCR